MFIYFNLFVTKPLILLAAATHTACRKISASSGLAPDASMLAISKSTSNGLDSSRLTSQLQALSHVLCAGRRQALSSPKRRCSAKTIEALSTLFDGLIPLPKASPETPTDRGKASKSHEFLSS